MIVMSHHPFSGGWLQDEHDISRWVRKKAHIHLSGHVHAADNSRMISGGGNELIHVVAGAAHGEKEPKGVDARHGYSFGALCAAGDGVEMHLWARRWSPENKDFRLDVHVVPDGKQYATHPIAGVKLSGAVLVKPNREGSLRGDPSSLSATVPAEVIAHMCPPAEDSSPPESSGSLPMVNNVDPVPSKGSGIAGGQPDIPLVGDRFKRLVLALSAAFPTNGALTRMVRFELGRSLVEFPGDSLSEQTFALVQWAESQGRVRDLLRGAQAENPGNPLLNAFVQSLAEHSVPMPPAGPAETPSRYPSPRPLPDSIAQAETRALTLLREHPQVVASLERRGLGADPVAITRALVHDKKAYVVIRALSGAFTELAQDTRASAEDQKLLRVIFNECLRFAVDWHAVIQGREVLRRGDNAFELPIRQEPVVELLLAGIHDELPAFDLSQPDDAVGLTRVKIPPALLGTVARTRDRIVEATVQHLAGTVFANVPSLDHARKYPASPEARADVEGRLRAMGFEGASDHRRPYYVLFGNDESDLWQVVCDATRDALPSLQLVRCTGTADVDEAATVVHINRLLHSPTKP